MINSGSAGIKFFKRSKCLFEDGTIITAFTGQVVAERCLDRNPIAYWRSVGSDDTISETLEIQFTSSITIDRIFLIDHNFKQFTVKYDVSGTWTHFSGVTGLSGAQANITETAFAIDTAYYEVSPVTTSKILVTIDKTQIADAQKYISQIVVTEELGTLVGFPQIKGTTVDRMLRNEKTLSGRILTLKNNEIFHVALDFKDYPAALTADLDLMFRLHDQESNFLIWLCGGHVGSPYFRYQLRGHRLRDLYPVMLVSPIKPIYSNNTYVNNVNFSCDFQEATG